MYWKDIKDNLLDLGFEETDSYEEYKSIIINATNRAIRILYSTVIPQIEHYLRVYEKWGHEENITDIYGETHTEWKFPELEKITKETKDEEVLSVPDVLEPLVQLLAAHYIWLDDDLTKSTIYWNEYDDLKDQIMMMCRTVRGAVIEGGW